MSHQRIVLAQITTAHGIKGFVKLRYFGENIEDIESYNPLYIAPQGEDSLTLQIKNAIKSGFVAEVEGVTDRTQAEKLRGIKLYIDRDQRPEAEPGAFYHDDLIGCKAYEEGLEIGKVIAIENFGAGDLIEIRPRSGEPFYLPFNNEFVPEVDIEKKQINVNIPEGLL